jgi:hypothetical protein
MIDPARSASLSPPALFARRLGLWPAPPDPGGDPAAGPRGWLRVAEVAVMWLVALLLGAAVVNDIVRAVHVNERMVVDKRTWRAYTHRTDLKKINVATGKRSNIDVACARATPGADERFCLVLGGPAKGPLRTIRGGYKLPVDKPNRYHYRWGCFGVGQTKHLCAHVVRQR